MEKILRFTSATCHPCKLLARTLDEMTIDQEIEVIDISEHPEAIDQYSIRGVPTMIYKGKQLVGNKTASEIREWLEAA
jgi:glutaredoxin